MAAGRSAVAKHDTARLIELDLEFHTGLYEAIGNRVLSEVMRGQWTHIRRVMAGTLTISGYPQQVWSEHGAILEAIESHNVNLAGMRAAAHTEAASTRLIQNLTDVLGKSEQEHAIVVEVPGRRTR
jgi:DNA-binding GntR family transcriptional regulator